MRPNPYRVFGTEVPRMLDRQGLLEKLVRHLTKETPDHVCVVGHPRFGKSVLLHHLFQQDLGSYLGSFYWDLRHGTPRTDEEFRRGFAERIKETVEDADAKYAGIIDENDASLSDLVHLALGELDADSCRILAILDGFDHVLARAGISRNFWDEMLAFARHSSLRLVTGSRKRLRELCKTEDSRTSDFWEVFYDSPVEVGHFADQDWEGFLAPFGSRDVRFDGSARREISNWTGGVPILAAALMEEVFARIDDGTTVSKDDIDRIAEGVLDGRRDLIAGLWDDCSIEAQSILIELSDREIPKPEIPHEQASDLVFRGYARESRNKLKASCRLLARFAHTQAPGVTSLVRLFGDPDAYRENIRKLLEVRLSQLSDVDSELAGYVEKAARDLLPTPFHSVIWARNIAARALELIWTAELPQDRLIPQEWKHAGVVGDKTGKLPRRPGPQCAVLRQITGSIDTEPVAKFVSKSTCLLVDHVQSVGDFGQHKEGDVSLEVAGSFCLAAIELCKCLADDLAGAQ